MFQETRLGYPWPQQFKVTSQMQWCMPVIPAFRRPREEDCKFKANLSPKTKQNQNKVHREKNGDDAEKEFIIHCDMLGRNGGPACYTLSSEY
jgi:hypothetical protein